MCDKLAIIVNEIKWNLTLLIVPISYSLPLRYAKNQFRIKFKINANLFFCKCYQANEFERVFLYFKKEVKMRNFIFCL